MPILGDDGRIENWVSEFQILELFYFSVRLQREGNFKEGFKEVLGKTC